MPDPEMDFSEWDSNYKSDPIEDLLAMGREWAKSPTYQRPVFVVPSWYVEALRKSGKSLPPNYYEYPEHD